MFPKKLTRQVICDMDNPVVETKAGKVRGLIVEDTYIFRGIRYAQAKRFQMPEKVTPWEGTKEAIVFGPVCCEISTPIAHDAYNVPHFYYPQDENCQYLNVWTQATDKSKKRPVMVWIHGGGFSTGSSVELYAYDGEELSRYGDVVVVSLNHRLNVLGFLDLSGYGAEYKYSGNVGMADIVAALEWIKENIAAFGGDPDNVTIMGQSGGGGKVSTLLQMPSADGLYHRAVIQSGIGSNFSNRSQDEAKAKADKILARLGISKDNIGDIESVPYYKLARAAEAEGGAMSWGPVYDGEYYLGEPRISGFRKETEKIPLMIGTCLGEFTQNFNNVYAEGSKNDWPEDQVAAIMKRVYGDNADKVAAAFKKAYPKRRPVDALFVDKMFRKGSYDYAILRAKGSPENTYMFMFNLEMPFNGGTLPWHNAEEAYMFHNAEYLEASYIPGVSEWLQDVMTGAWVAFAEKGDPNHVKMPYWTPVTPEGGEAMIFDEKCEMLPCHDAELMAAIPDKPMGIGNDRSPKRVLGGGPRQSI